ncbi:translocation/assembly module TamB domain-containing protein [Luteibacter flocculans]|uniref:Translocation/assembly module TamB domain-containing protein n=1 Tax=Luteibacter flocculans TaxID=2780091 RepID=A0ABY4SZT0_9GAMM|nr:translocation/assembly module TamB domain-containing protein [Luteibacter flocculans]URL57574.1 translocation/assembly module TamB domain-containing protein [Luteibacter flocculans]
MKWLIRVGMGLGVLLVVVALGVWWLVGTASGLRFALARAQAFTNGALTVQEAHGRLAGPLDLAGVRYRDGSGMDVRVAKAHLDSSLGSLLRRRAHVYDLSADGIAVELGPTSTELDSPAQPFSLKPPLDIVLDRVKIGRVQVTQQGQTLFSSNSLDLAGSWTSEGIALRSLALRSDDGHVDLGGTLAIGNGYKGDGKAGFRWKLGDIDYAGTIEAHSDGAKAHTLVNLTLPFVAQVDANLVQSGDFPWDAKIDAPRFDPKPLLGDSSLTSLGLALQGSGDRYGANLTGDVDLNDYRVRLAPIKGEFDHAYKRLTLDELTVGSPQVRGSLTAKGTVDVAAQPVSADLALHWTDVLVPANVAGQDLASTGRLTFKGSAEAYHAAGDVDIGPPGQVGTFTLDVDGTPRLVTLHNVQLKQPKGQLGARGTLTLQPALAWNLDVTGERFDPGQLFAEWPGALDLDLNTEGQIVQDEPIGTFDLRKLDGTLRKRPLRGNGKLTLKPHTVVNGQLDLASGGSTIRLDARGETSNDATLKLAIASLGDWLPDAGGRVNGDISAKGIPPKLAVKANLRGNAIVYADQKVDALTVDADIPDISAPGGKLDVAGTGVVSGGLVFDRVAIAADGNQERHQLSVSAKGRQLSADLRLTGAMKNDAWNGTLSALNIDYQGLPPWRLQGPSQLAWNQGAASMSDLCLTAGEPLLCVAAKQDKGGNLDASYRLRRVPLALLMTAAEASNSPMRADGIIEGDGNVRRTAAGALSGQATITSAHGSVAYADRTDRPLVVYDNLTANAQLAPDNQRVILRAALNDGGSLDGDVTVRGAQQALGGNVSLRLKNLSVIELFTTELADVKGALDAQFNLGGTVASPAITGRAVVDGFAAEVPSAGLKLKDGRLAIDTTDAKNYLVDGTVRSGEGSLSIKGNAALGAGAQMRLGIEGSKFTAVDIPAAKAVVSPNVTIVQDAKGMNVSGKVNIDMADVNVERLPGAGATKASPDIVVVDDAQREAAEESAPISADIRVDLGQKVHLVGFGIDGRITGQLDVRERPGRATTGQGQIGVDGTYKAYGQDLRIEQGQLLFATTPIDNPGLNIRAARTLNPNATIDEGQKVGLYVSGTARRPILTVFSNPVMEQSDALSYLVTGKPLSQVKGGEGNMVGAAAQALGSAAGDLLAKSVGSKIGIDDIGVSNNDALGGTSAFTVGKYLSPRLYLSYGVGLFDPGQVITLRYLFSRRWNFEAQNATDFSRASLNYRLER